MTGNGKSPVQVTTQIGSKNVTLSAESPEEMRDLTKQLLGVADDLVGNLVELDQIILGKTIVGQVGVPDNSPPAAAPPRAATVPPPGADGTPNCEHGPRVLRGGEKNGKTWSGYFCALPKGDPKACPVVWG